VTFDYTGLGQSTGEKTYNPASLAKVFLAMFGGDVSHVVLNCRR